MITLSIMLFGFLSRVFYVVFQGKDGMTEDDS